MTDFELSMIAKLNDWLAQHHRSAQMPRIIGEIFDWANKVAEDPSEPFPDLEPLTFG